jgi:hypothetical protein
MKRETSYWLRGQVDAIRKLAAIVRSTTIRHSEKAADELASIEYACNRAIAILDREAE